MRMTLLVAVCALLAPARAAAEAGVLIPSGREQPDPGVLSLDTMDVDVLIDAGHARVRVKQVFASHHGAPLEGNYVFALPGRAAVSDFAVWDGVTRIPGVILERRRSEEIYSALKWQAIDPGLLQMGERDADQARRSALFTARIVPIPAWGTKRLELEYQERLTVENLESFFTLPLKPDVYRAQAARRLSIAFELRSPHPLAAFEAGAKAFPLEIIERTPHLVKGVFEGREVALSEDFTARYRLAAAGDSIRVLAFRDTGPGFFEASATLAPEREESAAPRTVIALFDTSLSMQWEKLDRSFQALETTLRSLRPADRFNLILFNTEATLLEPAPVAAAPAAIEKALAFVRASRLRGGTNLQAALDAALKQATQGAYVVLFSDGGATRGVIQPGKLDEWYAARWRAERPHTYVFAVGDDAGAPLLKMLARHDGLLEWVRSTEPVDFKLGAFVGKIGRRPVPNLALAAEPAGNFDLVYRLDEAVFAGSAVSWVGQYRKPGEATFSVRREPTRARLPERDLAHPHLARAWAQARVDALLERIEREGEDRATIDEIIRLARRYKFVTPYTSFLAAPRALLRPRLIRPGDPILRVKTDPSVVSVVALFPFGLVKKLRYLESEDTWQTRFLAPPDLRDGTHRVRLILRDRKGQTFRESKTFVIASQPPLVRVRLDKPRYRRGETVRLSASASETTRAIFARMYGVGPVPLRWNAQAAANTGEFVVPDHLPAGRYTLTVTAEDFAHNMGSHEAALEVTP